MTIETVHQLCRRILESGSLEEKLAPIGAETEVAPGSDGPAPSSAGLVDPMREPLFIDRPTRTGSLQLHSTSERLPKLGELKDPSARAVCLERFGNHELMAVELFAWALLAYPDAPPALRRGLVHVLQEEQGHVRLYMKRLEEVGSGLGQSLLGDYFWQQVPGIRASSNGLVSFLCVMGLTLEQANLDFSLLYRDTFRRHGDDLSAQLLGQIHDDEIGHVRLASNWLRRLAEPGVSDVETYRKYVPFPLSAARAKGRHFHPGPRQKAGLSAEMIEFVREARPYPREKAAPVRQWGGVNPLLQLNGTRCLFPNIGAEEGRAPRRGRREIDKMAKMWSALFEAPMTFGPSTTSTGHLARYLTELRGLVPWWANPDAAEAAAVQGLDLTAASPATTRAVHDKAFSIRAAQAHRLDGISHAIEIFEPAEILSADFQRRIEGIVSSWPDPWRKRFVLKPRIGTTGRGWVRGLDGELVDPGGIQRLAQRGGAILEPWLDRVEDYSVQLWIDESGRAEVLGMTIQELSPSGKYLGNRGIVRDGQFLLSDSAASAVLGEIPESLQRTAQIVGDEAARVGYRGACGIDAFSYRGESGIELRPLVELNARFTGGWVVLGWVERLYSACSIDGPAEWRFRWKGADSDRWDPGDPFSPTPSVSPFCVYRLLDPLAPGSPDVLFRPARTGSS